MGYVATLIESPSVETFMKLRGRQATKMVVSASISSRILPMPPYERIQNDLQ